MIDTIMQWLYDIAVVAIGWLPDSPFQTLAVDFSNFKNIMGYINYFVPIGDMIIFFGGYLSCVLIWYAARWVLRLTKYID